MPLSVVDRWLGSLPGRLAVLAVATAGVVVMLFAFPYRIDLDVYRTGAQVFLNGASIYGPMPQLAEGAHLPFTYPPIAAALFTVFAVVPLWAASFLLTITSIACLALTLRIVIGAVSARPSLEVWWLVVGAMAAGLWFAPVQKTLTYGQINIVLMALVVVDAMWGQSRWWGGALVGIAIAIKLTPAVFLLLFLLRRQWRVMVTTAVSFLACSAIGHLLMPEDSLLYWTQTLTDTGRIGGAAYASNQSISGVLHRLGIDSGAAWFVLAMAAGLLITWVAWRLLQFGHQVAALVVVGFAALLCSPVSWGHHWVWALPLVVLLLAWARADAEAHRWRWLAGTGAVVFVARMHWWFPNTNNQELDWNLLQQTLGASYLIWSLAALVTIGAAAHRVPVRALTGSRPLSVSPATGSGSSADA